MPTGRREVSEREEADSHHAMPNHTRAGVRLMFGPAQQFLGDAQRRPEFSSHVVENELPVQHLEDLRRLPELPAQRERPGVGSPGFRCRRALRRAQPAPERHLQVEFLTAALAIIGQRLQQRQPLAELADRLRGRRAGEGLLPRPCAGTRPPGAPDRPARSDGPAVRAGFPPFPGTAVRERRRCARAGAGAGCATGFGRPSPAPAHA